MTEEQKQATRDRIGQRIAALRKLAGWSQEQLSERAGLQRTHISRIEAGKYAVTLETIQAIAEAFGMTVDIIDPAIADLPHTTPLAFGGVSP
jgi:transcriptional regulator with XRE-family HTH domain